ncbi:pilus assembly protein [Shewanella maritima]|uniref:pilus assembly protein n=1 Tax=Shewanella maritima TaxID=2520507 RepID=UPI003734FF60
MIFNKILKVSMALICSFYMAESVADDTDLYLNPSITNIRPQVLIIFDNSGSMRTIVEGLPGGYDPDQTYPPVGSSNSYDGRMIYFTVGTGMDGTSLPVPDSPSESRRFNDLVNGCKAARDALNTYGRFTGYIREFKTTGQGKGSWQPLKENSGAETNSAIDCWEDIQSEVNSNNNDGSNFATGYPNGFPQNGDIDNPWGNSLENAKQLGWNNGELVSLYTDNYLRWYTLYDQGLLDNLPEESAQSRLDIAKEAISGVISTIPSVDFGLAIFNMNYSQEGDRDGGRIIAGIRERTPAERDDMVNTVNNLSPLTNTPLCETLYEAYQYFSGGSITFGHADEDYGNGNDKYTANVPPYDTSVEKNGKYLSPFSACSKVAHIIYITDGEPTLDDSANEFVKALNDDPYEYAPESNGKPAKFSYMPALAEYMFNNDLLPNLENKQTVITHTIGFSLADDSVAEPLLIETAKRSRIGENQLGTYSSADDVVGLQAAISNIINTLPSTGRQFSAPGVAFSNADPTRTLDSAYFAVFRPEHGPKWGGNLKKFKVTSDGTLVDAKGNNAINSSGGIKDDACSFWSDCTIQNDGNDIELGGIARGIDPDKRTIYSNIGGISGLTVLNKTNASFYAGGDSALATYLGLPSVNTADELNNTFEWIKGKNVDVDSDGVTMSSDYDGVRGDIIGDPLHSEPVAIDYGAGDVRIYFGTNHGVLHAIKDKGTTFVESWAFMPYELLPNLQTIRRNTYLSGHSVYGIDGSPVSYIERNSDGSIALAYIFVGMRRGGESYYAFNVTNPDSPTLMWKISNTSTGFANLGQTWSTPIVTKVPSRDKPVVIFGGGYNVGYDSNTGSNSFGIGVYIVEADSGKLVHQFGPDGSTSLPGISDSIAAQITPLDSDGDGITDRLYAVDLGGAVWRMDMPTADKSSWSAFKFASLNGSGLFDNRKLFYPPIVAQTKFTNSTEVSTTAPDGTVTTSVSYQDVAYDAIAIGSGDRADPLGTNTYDQLYVLQDRNVFTKTFGTSLNPTPVTLTVADLYDVSDSWPHTDNEAIAFGKKRGWFYQLPDNGEKSLSAASIVKGKVYFTSFVPLSANSGTIESCAVSSLGRLYTFDLHKGGRYLLNNGEWTEVPPDYPYSPPVVCVDCISVPPKLIIPPKCEGADCDKPTDPGTEDECESSLYALAGSGECDASNENCTGTISLNACMETKRIYYHLNENN